MNEPVNIKIRYRASHAGLPPLSRMTGGSSGFDLQAACTADIGIEPGTAALVPCGIELSIPEGYEGQVRPRSGLALNNRVGVLNAPGTIDSDYRGEVCVILHNFGDEVFVVRRGARIAQLVFCRLPRVEIIEEDRLDPTDRGAGGFGHTG
jgi:dUTP pyrophosphatase